MTFRVSGRHYWPRHWHNLYRLTSSVFSLPLPFFAIAPRNLAEPHGPSPLPQSQLDRFLVSFGIGYPQSAEEIEILERHEYGQPKLSPVLTASEIINMQDQVLT